MNQTKIKKDRQDRNSLAWKKLCDYIDEISINEDEDFFPRKHLGDELFGQIYTLPESIGKLDKVQRIVLYGSNLVSIPPQIGQMQSLEVFVPYTSYELCWFPYEITRCINLKDSTVSTRALYGNPKNKKQFPDLLENTVRYNTPNVKCSICGKEMSYDQTKQYWISLWVGTDVLPLLVNLCSYECGMQLPKPAENYLPYPHKGGTEKQPIIKEDFI